MDVKNIGVKDDMECILCGRCTSACKKDSLKLGYRFTGAGVKGLALLLPIILISSSMLVIGVYNGGYERTDAINAIPCLGCLALDPKSPEGWFAVEDLPDFIMEPLADGPVIIDYRTTVCAACDEMDPHVHALAEEYEGRVHFIMHPENFENLDDYAPDSIEYQSYFIFDVKGSGTEITGVPLFPIITYRADENGTVGIYFKVFYGSSADGGITQKANIAQALDEAVELHDLYGGGTVYYSGEQTPFVELFVAMDCVNCPKSEEALLDIIEEDDYVNFVSYVGDAPGESGAQALEREYYLAEKVNLSVIGRPWAVFGGGPEFELGALSQAAVTQIYRDKIKTTYLEPLNVSITGNLIDNTNNLHLNISVAHDDNNTQSLRVQVFVLEVKSRWLNHYTHHPIPYAVVDIPVNDTHDIAGGTIQDLSFTWTGTNDLSYSELRISNLATMVVVWKGDNQVTSKIIESGVPEFLWMISTDTVQSALPTNTANYTLAIHNDRGTPMTVNLSAMSVPSSLIINISQSSVTIPANSKIEVPITATGTSTAIGDSPSFMIHAEDVTDTTLSSTVTFQMEVKGDIAPPVIVNVEHTPETLNADQLVEISATVGDNVGIESVVVQYYSCDDLACSPTFTVPMILESGKYVHDEDIMPRELFHNIFHYWIIAEDTSGNIARTYEYNVTVTPVETPHDHEGDVGGTSIYNTWGIGLIIIFAMVAIGLNLARMRKVPIKDIKPDGSLTETEEEMGEVGSRQWALAMIKYVESQVEDGKRIGAEFSEVENLLSGARMMVVSGTHEDAYDLLNQCSEDAGQRILDYERLASTIQNVEIEIKAAQDNGKDTTEAKSLLKLARHYQAEGDYTIALRNAKKSIEALTTKK